MNIIKDINLLNCPEIVEHENLNAEFIHLQGPMLFGMQMATINLSLMDFRYMGVLMGFREKFCGYGFAAVIMIPSSQLIFS